MARRGGGPIAALAALAALAAGCGGSDRPAEPRRITRVIPPGQDEGDEVALAQSRGVLEPEQVRAGVDPHRGELSDCYTSRVGRRRWLGGALSLRWQVAGDGSIEQVHVAESDLGAWPVERCMLGVARRMVFAAPRGGSGTDFAVPLELSATGSATRWDEAQSAEAVGEQLAQLDGCSKVDAGLEPAPAPPTDDGAVPAVIEGHGGTAAPSDVVVTLYVSSRGQPQSVGFATAAPEGLADRWAQCAEKLALAWRIPGVGGSAITKLTVRYAGITSGP